MCCKKGFKRREKYKILGAHLQDLEWCRVNQRGSQQLFTMVLVLPLTTVGRRFGGLSLSRKELMGTSAGSGLRLPNEAGLTPLHIYIQDVRTIHKSTLSHMPIFWRNSPDPLKMKRLKKLPLYQTDQNGPIGQLYLRVIPFGEVDIVPTCLVPRTTPLPTKN